MNKYIFLIFGLWLTSCSKPIADFVIISENASVPSELKLENNSEGADAFIWKINGEVVSDSVDYSQNIYESGRYTIELIAQKGSQKKSNQKEIVFSAPQECLVLMKTSVGDLLLELSELTPNHRDNFLKLVESSYYDGIIFHRVIDGFMIQAGDNSLRKSGDVPFSSQKIDKEFRQELIHKKGALAAARMPDNINPNKQSSPTQFYIVKGTAQSESSVRNYEAGKLNDYSNEQIQAYLDYGGAPQLDGEYTIFGQLIDGFDVLDKISATNTDNRDKPIEDIIILKVISIN